LNNLYKKSCFEWYSHVCTNNKTIM